MKTLFTVGLGLLVATSAGRTDDIPETSGTSEGVVQKDRIELDVSAKLKWASTFRDGGSIMAELADKTGKTLVLRKASPFEQPQAVEIVVRYENKRGGLMVKEKYALEAGSEREKALLSYLKDWTEKNLSKERQAKISAVRGLKKYEDWNKEYDGLSAEDQHVYQLLSVVEFLGKKR
jgi:hypothetical protein